MILPVEDNLCLEFWELFRGYINDTVPRLLLPLLVLVAVVMVCQEVVRKEARRKWLSDGKDQTCPKELDDPNYQEII